jgi:hypothetical protein
VADNGLMMEGLFLSAISMLRFIVLLAVSVALLFRFATSSSGVHLTRGIAIGKNQSTPLLKVQCPQSLPNRAARETSSCKLSLQD